MGTAFRHDRSDWPIKQTLLRWNERDVILYALGLGYGADPADPQSLRYIYERNLLPIPTMLTALTKMLVPTVEELGGNYKRSVHYSQEAVFHQAIEPAGSALVYGYVQDIIDRGSVHGALINIVANMRDEIGQPLATLKSTVLARDDGGFSGTPAARQSAIAAPARAPDHSKHISIMPHLAAIYRLSGDPSALHIDPDAAIAAGFPSPILHGLCSYGIACRAVIETIAGHDPRRIRAHRARFSAPMFPGETLRIDLWEEPERQILFEAWVTERNCRVLSEGCTWLH
ncbi:3-alpha,7-alpha,12-alpha-trihydroxy-5-beta-cholest-24-enoyl-CoA hydratase [Sphingobium sp. SCG-1]|uniref:MaoC family dehydratase n=1 Tax=Sphingobium sp. SCG-1 TaxID=2072936 RepID=UPI000CD6B954|nr:MaoC family dehydratase [Sphingobium sp. SCG-1]AUW59694.1 3-alpha,7-alpha,12-alpha-trihydroxy-5-beta-cholest-24-enoyl-CoA hydratase [Sphingobium sp. SCG-1]